MACCLPGEAMSTNGKPVGRPTKRNPEREAKIIEAIRAGNYIETSAHLGGIGISTLYEWRDKYPKFAEAIEKARAEAEAASVALVQSAAIENWQAAAWWLERSFPDKYGRRTRVEHGGEVTIHEQSDFDKEIAALMDEMASRSEAPVVCPSPNGHVAGNGSTGAATS